jgi:hypothetical protein
MGPFWVDGAAVDVIQAAKLESLESCGYELSDYEWTAIKPMLPNKPRGVRRVNDRRVLNGIFWVLRSVRHGATCQRTMGHTQIATIAACAGTGWHPGSDHGSGCHRHPAAMPTSDLFLNFRNFA